jgi:hypothetical protein
VDRPLAPRVPLYDIMASRLLRLSVLALAISAAACASAFQAPPEGPGAPTAATAVEQFLRLAADQEYLAMGWVFGTDKGAVLRRDPPRDVERRMHAIANILKNDMFVIRSQTPVPGRIGGAFRFDVVVSNSGREYLVPFTAVRGPDARWFIEDIKLDVITSR